MLDGIELEKMGIPAAVIFTEEFVPTARAMAEIGGIPSYNFAVVPHPIGSLTQEDLMERAKLAAPQVMELLLNRK